MDTSNKVDKYWGFKAMLQVYDRKLTFERIFDKFSQSSNIGPRFKGT